MRRWRDGWRHLKSIVMLAPNRALLVPAALVALGSVALLGARPHAAWTGFVLAYLIGLMGFEIKLMLHVDRVRPSRMVELLLRFRSAEAGIFLGLALLGCGVAMLVEPAASAADSDVLGALLVAAGGATLVGVLFFETVRTHLVSDLEAAWRGAPPHDPRA
jgi:predicted membrane channel-forming protein YqfA (hemolysin III family)